MFSLDSDLRSSTSNNSGVTVGPEGESDDNPIRLQGDTADEFRSLLWALYALYVHFLPLRSWRCHKPPISTTDHTSWRVR